MTAADILFSFGFTWSIGLGLPALVRYTLYRRPLEKSEALGWACGLGMVEFVLFTLLGSQSKTHAVLLLVGVVAFRIMKAARGPFDRQAAPQSVAERSAPIEHSQTSAPAAAAVPVGQVGLHLGWHRLWAVVAFCWLAVIGGRLAYELIGKPAELYLSDKTEVPANFTDLDFASYEWHLKALLKSSPKAEVLPDAVAITESDLRAAEIERFVQTRNKELNERLDRLLKDFDLPRLSPEAVATLATELSVPAQGVYDSEKVARRYLQVRELRQSMAASPILRYQVMGEKPPVYTTNFPATLLALFGPPLLLLLVWLVFRWVRRGFVAQA